MRKPFKGTINIDIKDSVPDWEPYAQPVPPEGTPNVLYVVLDDVGFSAMESFGGPDRDAEHQTDCRPRPRSTRTSTPPRCVPRRAPVS